MELNWAHLAACLLVVGAFGATLLAGHTDRPTALAWQVRVVRAARWLLLAAVATGIATLAQQTALVEGRAGAALDARAILRFALETQGGIVWIARHGLLVLLAAFVALPADDSRRIDWLAARGESALLALAALALLALSGHAAAIEPSTAVAVAVDAIHLLGAGLWIGALLPVAALLLLASRERGADARPYAVLAARRFSSLALMMIAALVASGVWNAAIQVGSVAALVGTTYGRLLLLKLAILLPILTLAGFNRRLLPALSGDGASMGRPAMRRLARSMAMEAALALLLVGVVAAMRITPPAEHVEPTWPFSVRFSLAAVDGASRARLLVGSQLAVLGVAALLAAAFVRRRAILLAGGAVLVAGGLALSLPPLAVDAYPTTYVRPAATYNATSIAQGARLYAEHCAACHGASGAGDGPDAARSPRRPVDLLSAQIERHTAGDLYWWITRGVAPAMPAYGDRLEEDERWDVVNFVRALAAAVDARRLEPIVEPNRPSVVAPDFSFRVGPMPPRTLRDYRGRRMVLLVLYSLPASRPRLAQLANGYGLLVTLGAEVIAVPRDAAPDAIARIGDEPRTLFPIVTEGAPDILATYGLFVSAPHAELLIDRQGYLRARWEAAGETVREINLLLAEIQQLNEEKAPAPLPDEHVH